MQTHKRHLDLFYAIQENTNLLMAKILIYPEIIMDKARPPGIESPALPFSSCMTLSKLLELSLSQFPHL